MNYYSDLQRYGLDCWFDNDWLRPLGVPVEYLLAASLMAIPGGSCLPAC